VFKNLIEIVVRFAKYTFFGLTIIGIYTGIIVLISYIFGDENGSIIVVILTFLLMVGAIIWYVKKREKEIQRVDLKANEPMPLLTKIFISFIGLLFVIGLFSDNNKTAQPVTPVQNTTSIKVPIPTKTTFYTNGISNVRTCGSTACDTIIQTQLNTPISLEYQNIESMPEWVPLSWTEGTVSKKGFISKSVLSTIQTYPTPTYTPSSYGSSYHTDNDYKYNYRTGYSGSYDYNYDVSGSGDNGDVSGNIDTSGKYGDGYIYDENDNEIHVETEWIDNGVMEATDDDGNTYELEVQ
jgi:hypothetical protein